MKARQAIWKREAAVWRKCADRLANAVEHYRGSDAQHETKSKALTIYRAMALRRDLTQADQAKGAP